MTRLKDRHTHLPGGFQVLHPEIGMEKPFSGSFTACCDFERNFRRQNSFLCKKNNWTLDDKDIEDFVEAQNVARAIAHGWGTFLIVDGEDAARIQEVQAQKKTSQGSGVGAGAAGAVRKASAGIGVVLNWLGSGLEPVQQELAEKRAAICAVCPKNSVGDFFQRVSAAVAEEARKLIGVAKDLRLETKYDGRLHTCSACGCLTRLKVWVPLKHITDGDSPETVEAYHESCWIKNLDR